MTQQMAIINDYYLLIKFSAIFLDFETPHLYFETTHFKIETPHLYFEMTHFKIETCNVDQVLQESKIDKHPAI